MWHCGALAGQLQMCHFTKPCLAGSVEQEPGECSSMDTDMTIGGIPPSSALLPEHACVLYTFGSALLPAPGTDDWPDF